MVLNCTVPAVGAGAGKPIQIALNGDFVIRLAPPLKPLAESNTANNRLRAVEFRVSRGVMIAHSVFFRDLFRVQPTLTIISIDDNPSGIKTALELWLRAIHNGADSLLPSLQAEHSRHVWNAMAVGEQFGFTPEHLGVLMPWFLAFYHDLLNKMGLKPMVARALAYPCFVFGHAKGFMKVTKYLVYNTTGPVFVQNPSNFNNLSTNARLLDGPLTRAKYHVQNTLERELRVGLDKLYRANCACRKETAFDYEDALRKVDCWPLDRVLKKATLNDIVEKLKQFKFTPKVTNCESGVCQHDFNRSVTTAISRAKCDFDGLCLDCMTRSKLVTGRPKQEFVEKNSPFKGCWDMGCRFGHGRETWIFSWMGPFSICQDILEKDLDEKRRLQVANPKRAKSSGDFGKLLYATPNTSDRVNGNSLNNNPNAHDDRNNTPDIEDSDEFFDAEDVYVDDFTAVQGFEASSEGRG